MSKVKRKCDSRVNVEKMIAIVGLVVLAGLNAACTDAGPTPTRTPRAVADSGNATQTPWFVYVPVTTTPEPFTVTSLPTVTSSAPTPRPTNTRPPRPAATTKPTVAPTTAIPPTAGPTDTPVPSCGQVFQVNAIGASVFPKDGDTRDTSATGAGRTIQFKFPAAVSYQLDPTIGYRIDISRANGPIASQRYMSHNGYLIAQNGNGIVLDARALWILSGGGDTNLTWTVTVIKVSGGFDDVSEKASGSETSCGDPAGPFRIYIHAA